MHVAGDLFLFFEELRHLLELLVFQDAGHQAAARVFGLFGAGLGRLLRKQHARLDLDQFRGHYHELLRHLNIVRLRLTYVFDVLSCDLRDFYVVDAHPVLLYQIDQKIERPFESLELYLVDHYSCSLNSALYPLRCSQFLMSAILL